MTVTYFPGRAIPSEDSTGERQHRQEIARAAASAMKGQTNNTLSLTLDANATTTTITDARISIATAVLLSPMTAHAAAEIGAGTLWIVPAAGVAVVNHANSAQADRTFQAALVG